VSIARERLIAGAALIFSVLALATSVEIGRNCVEALLTAVVSYGTAVLAAVLVLTLLGVPVGIRPIIKATRTVVTAAVVIGLVLYGMGRSLWGVIA
jgi:VIT1/CCC1 family predicted Fe2+/Mn2+ transporter